MSQGPLLSRIIIYPLKSFDPLELTTATVLPSGALRFDRQFALVDDDNQFINAKRDRRVHGVSLRLDPTSRQVTMQVRGDAVGCDFSIDRQRAELECAVSAYFGRTVHLIENAVTGFPDDSESPGPTVISAATLDVVASWFPSLTVEETRLRFRANLEIGGTESFWEDRLFGSAAEVVPFEIGEVGFEGVNPCQRCVVPARNPCSGGEFAGFAREFSRRRQDSLPKHAVADRFDHFYRLATNTRLATAGGGVVCVGDPVIIRSGA